MPQIINDSKEIEDYYQRHLEILRKIHTTLKDIIKNKRQITYSDIINFIIKENYKNEIYTQIIVWCNYNIRKGNFFVDF
ncbi:MAG: hypothetical protein EU531_07435 [Promethearchaeota archaeon]|nr:MAG: hypothetical protein EU531_07435 [Candidatus Lokiarchaeota archaeon]